MIDTDVSWACNGHRAEQAAEEPLEEHRRSRVRQLGFYKIEEELRKVSVQIYIGLAAFWGSQTQPKCDFLKVQSLN